jgi:hypothetical protein
LVGKSCTGPRLERSKSNATLATVFRSAAARWSVLARSAQSETRSGSRSIRISLVSRMVAIGNDRATECPKE